MTITDKLKYYIGAKCVYREMQYLIMGIEENGSAIFNVEVGRKFVSIDNITPILKRLQNMTEEDAIQMAELIVTYGRGNKPEAYQNAFKKWVVSFGDGMRDKYVPQDQSTFSPAQFHYLLSKGYWLFEPEAFEEGLVIDEKTLEK